LALLRTHRGRDRYGVEPLFPEVFEPLLGFRDAGHDSLGDDGDFAGEVRRVPRLTNRTAIDLRSWRDGRVPVDHLKVKWNAALAAVYRQDCSHGEPRGKPNVLGSAPCADKGTGCIKLSTESLNH